MKKRIIKKYLFVLLLFFSAFLSLGCHGGKTLSPFDLPNEFDLSKDYEITFWAKNDSNPTQIKIYKKAIEDFNKYYPKINVVIRTYTDYQEIYRDVITNLPTKTTPNVCISYPDHVATYSTGENVIVPLNSLITNPYYGLGGSKIKFDSVKISEMNYKYLQEGYFDGNYYTLPFVRSTEACYINKDYVERLGYTVPDILTWDYIFEVSEKAISLKEDDQILIPMIYKSTDNMMIQMLKQKNAGYSDELGHINIFNNTTKEILTTIGIHAKSKAFSTFTRVSYPGNFFNAGQCIFAIDSTAGSTWIGSNAPLMDIDKLNVEEFETVVRMIPQYDISNPKMISQGPSICIFNKDDKQEVLASWLFAQFLLTNNVQIEYTKTEGYIPVTTKAQQSTEYNNYLSRRGEDNDLYYSVKIDAVKLLLNNIDNTFVTPVFNGSVDLRSSAGQMIEEIVKTAIKKNGVPIDDVYFENLFSTIQKSFKLDQIVAKDDESLYSNSKVILGDLPLYSKWLLITLGSIWILIGSYVLIMYVKKRKTKEK